MRWIFGFYPDDKSVGFEHIARNAVQLDRNMWSCGYVGRSVRSVTNGQATLIVAGLCFATETELLSGLEAACAQRWSETISWPGAYVSVLQAKGQTVVVGSLAGTTRVYYARTAMGYLWSSAATPLAAYIGSEIDYHLLVSDMAVGGIEFDQSATYYKDVAAVPPGSYLKLNKDGVRVSTWYRRKLHSTFEEAAHDLRVGLHDAMTRRATVEGKLSGDFSGGFDSTTLVLRAAEHRRVLGLTYTDPWIGGDDLRFARAVAKDQPNIDHQVIEGGLGELDYTDLDQSGVPVSDLPTTDLVVAPRDRKMLAVAAAWGSTHHLNGEGGDALFDAARSNFADQWSAGQSYRAIRMTMAYARRTQVAPAKMVAAVRRLVHTSPREALRDLVSQLENPVDSQTLELTRPSTMTWYLLLPSAAWLSSAARMHTIGLLQDKEESVGDYCGPGHYHDWSGLHTSVRNTASLPLIAESFGLTLDLPYLDTALVDTCMSLPGYEKMQLAQFKPLLVTALPELPHVLRRRTTKVNFDAAAAMGVYQNADWLRQIVSSSQLIARGLLHGDLVRGQLECEIAGLQVPSSQIQKLVTRELWLDKVDLSFDSWWEAK